MGRVIIDPVTRVGGQLRIEVDVTAGTVASALVSSTMFRGVEGVLVRRDPRDVWMLAQRVCGTCTGVHALASVRAVERALDIRIPTNARLVRNVLAGTMHVRDHAMAFYQRALPDWVDIGAAVKADTATTARLALATSAWPASDAGHFKQVRDRLAALLASDQPGPFGSWPGHPAYRLTPEQSLLLMSHMLDALDWQRDFLRIEALFGGKDPHPQTWLVGGVALAPPWGGPAASQTRQHPQVPARNAPIALSDAGLTLVTDLIAGARKFVEQVLVPDVALLVNAYPEYAALGRGPGNYLAFGEYPLDDARTPVLLLPAGRLVGGNLERAEQAGPDAVEESSVHAWYADPSGAGAPQPPAAGTTEPAFDAPVPLTTLDSGGRYTWTKAARYDGLPMETGPLARILVGAANGQNEIRLALAKAFEQTGLSLATMGSVDGRMVARALEAQVMVRQLDAWVWELRQSLSTGDVALVNVESWDPVSWPDDAEGWSLGEGPRGAVGHWLGIHDGTIERYQIVDGSTWNASPRDKLGQRGPLEAALEGTPVADPSQPLEILRVVHSMAPCAACAAHVLGDRPFPQQHATATEAIR